MSKSKITDTEHSFRTSDPVVVSANAGRKKIDSKRRSIAKEEGSNNVYKTTERGK
jgi:hypothetical protein